MTMAMELIRHIAGLYSGKAIKGDFTQVFITGNEIWMAQQVLAEQAEGVQGERERFEVEMLELCLPIERDSHGAYVSDHVRHLWSGWELRAALAQPSPARCQCCGYLVTDSEHRGCLRSAYPVVVTLNDSGAILAVTRQDAEGSVLSVIAEAQSSPKCATCNDNGRIGGPSFYAPDEGGDPCPDCAQPSPAPELDDQAFDRNAERLTLQALGPGAGINPEATSIDDLFLDEAPAPGMERPEVVAWSNWKVGTRSHIPFRTEEEAARSVNASEIAATQEGPYSVEPLMTVSQHRRIDAARLASVRVLADEVLELAAQRDAAQARVAELIAALEHAAASMWNSEANMDNAAAEAEEAIGNAKSGAPVAQAGQVPEGYMLITQDQVERHATTAWECPPQSRVVLVSTLKRLHEKNSTAPQPAKEDVSDE